MFNASILRRFNVLLICDTSVFPSFSVLAVIHIEKSLIIISPNVCQLCQFFASKVFLVVRLSFTRNGNTFVGLAVLQ